MPKDALKSVVEHVKRVERVVVFTGAGLSTASGIPDFRGPKGLWKRRQPVYFQDFIASEEARVEHWDYKLEAYSAFRDAKPNAAHKALVDLEQMGKLDMLITQNIDGLHEAAGNDPARIIELHGSNRWMECLDCAKRFEPGPLFEQFSQTRKPPVCACGGFLKAATVMFGQPMPQQALQRAMVTARDADFLIAAGSTLEVEPAASVPMAGAANGVPYAVINQGRTAHDGVATFRFEGDVTKILPAIVEGVRRPAG